MSDTTRVLTIEVVVTDADKFKAAAWEAAQSGGFTTVEEWEVYQANNPGADVYEVLTAGMEPAECGFYFQNWQEMYP